MEAASAPKARGVKMGRKPKLTPHQQKGDQAPGPRRRADGIAQLQCQSHDDFEDCDLNTAVAYMLDTTLFNHVLDGKISPSSLEGRRLLATGIQRDELAQTRDNTRRTKLLAMFQAVNPEVVPASSFAFDIEGAGFDQACWNDGSGCYDKMLARLQQLDPRSKNAANQKRDILIAETAIKSGVTLVSGDANLRRVVTEFGGCAITDFP